MTTSFQQHPSSDRQHLGGPEHRAEAPHRDLQLVGHPQLLRQRLHLHHLRRKVPEAVHPVGQELLVLRGVRPLRHAHPDDQQQPDGHGSSPGLPADPV